MNTPRNNPTPADKVAITEVINQLFVYTDFRNWQKIIDLVFTDEVMLDMSSAGGPHATILKSAAICQQWEQAFTGLDAIHHQAGNYIIDTNGKTATVIAYAIASHYKASALKGHTRTFVGSYDLKLVLTANGWRISHLTYLLKYTEGNGTLQ